MSPSRWLPRTCPFSSRAKVEAEKNPFQKSSITSARKHGQFIAINCGSIPEGTIDSELFGHEKGSFTGAHEARKGYFEVTNGGTIFLDEIGEMPLEHTGPIAACLGERGVYKSRFSKVLKTDVRVVAATNINLMRNVEEGKFREDLYYRLKHSSNLCTTPAGKRKGY